MKTKPLILISLLLTVFLFFIFFQKTNSISKTKDHQKIAIQIAEHKLEVEVVNTPESITRGLSAREQLGSDGMLFILPQRIIPSFWMKDMQFNLDFVWIDGDRVIDLTENVPAPDSATKLSDLPVYSPQSPVDKVLELEAGKAQKWGIEIGEKIKLIN